MSSYFKQTKRPDTGEFEEACWMDDHFSHHHYGVKFKDGTIFDPWEVKLETRESTKVETQDEFMQKLREFGEIK